MSWNNINNMNDMSNINNITICKPKNVSVTNVRHNKDDKILKKMLCDFKKDFKNDLNNLTNTFDTQLENDTNYIQLQINDLNKKYLDVQKFINYEDNRYINIVNELNNLYEITYNNIIKIEECCDCSCKECKDIMPASYDDPTQITTLKYNCESPKMIFITAVGGGGAGGVGFVCGSWYYCSGGGGGAGSCIINYPVKLVKGTTLTIHVGCGGDATKCSDATDSYVTVTYPDNTTIDVRAYRGENGIATVTNMYSWMNNSSQNVHTDINDENKMSYAQHLVSYDDLLRLIKGGKGGKALTQTLIGEPGYDGQIAIPSFATTQGGTGGSSLLYTGGMGGSNMFSVGGAPGSIDNLIGQDGKYGSGGGGSTSLLSRSITGNKYSGNGGNGIVIIT